MLYTLHGYILRELLKTFALATIALTGLLTMGGALFNALRYEGISAADVPLLTPLIAPAMLTVAMPLAAIFSATLTYGRFAADNELNACRAAGINVHRLMVAALLLALFVSLVALFGANILIPGIYRTVERYARNNIGVVAASQLESRAFIDFAKEGRDSHLITCNKVLRPTREALLAKGFDVDPRITYLIIDNPRYLHRSPENQLKRFILADKGFCQFDARTNQMSLSVTVKGGYDYDPGGGTISLDEQTIGPFYYSISGKTRASLVELHTLVDWLRRPWIGGDVAAEFRRLRHELVRLEAFRTAERAISDGGTLTLADDLGNQYDIKAASFGPASLGAAGSGLQLTNCEVACTRADGEALSRFTAGRALLTASLPGGNDLLGNMMAEEEVELRLRLLETADAPVLEYVAGSELGPQARNSHPIDKLVVPESAKATVAEIPPQALLDRNHAMDLPEKLAELRKSVIDKARRLHYRVRSLIHFRFAVALAVLLTVLIAATLGAGFRGSQLLTAFGISCIPGAAVAVLIFVGHSTADRAATHTLGVILMWGGLAGVAVLEWFTLRALVKR
ncbi:MAG: LptF/LptG family permease [Phycisphaerae bacterium]|nr:LptF/LptG family permease [Phycisphaerae bacterium]